MMLRLMFFAFAAMAAASGVYTDSGLRDQNQALQIQNAELRRERDKYKAMCSWLELQLKSIRLNTAKQDSALRTLKIRYRNMTAARETKAAGAKMKLKSGGGSGYDSKRSNQRQAKSRGDIYI
jgi:hypothetical protein